MSLFKFSVYQNTSYNCRIAELQDCSCTYVLVQLIDILATIPVYHILEIQLLVFFLVTSHAHFVVMCELVGIYCLQVTQIPWQLYKRLLGPLDSIHWPP
jgi:hypothetical protein